MVNFLFDIILVDFRFHLLQMPPKTKKRKVKESEEEILIQEKLTEAFFKYRHDEEVVVVVAAAGEDYENVGMFGTESDEIPKIHVSDMERVAKEVGIEWDEVAMIVVDKEKMQKGIIDIETMKLVIATLKVNRRALDFYNSPLLRFRL